LIALCCYQPVVFVCLQSTLNAPSGSQGRRRTHFFAWNTTDQGAAGEKSFLKTRSCKRIPNVLFFSNFVRAFVLMRAPQDRLQFSREFGQVRTFSRANWLQAVRLS